MGASAGLQRGGAQCCLLSLTSPPLMVPHIHLEVSLPKARGQGSEEPQSLKVKTEQGPSVTQVLPQVWCAAYFKRNSKSLFFLMAPECVFLAPHAGDLTVCLLTSTVCTGPGPQGQCHCQTVPFRANLCSFSSFLPTPSLVAETVSLLQPPYWCTVLRASREQHRQNSKGTHNKQQHCFSHTSGQLWLLLRSERRATH